MENFNAAYAEANLLYGLELDSDDFEEVGLIAWNKIGNKQTKLHQYRTEICSDLSVELPCNCDFIVAVTYDYEDWQTTTNHTINGDFNSSIIENYIEGSKMYKNPMYASGKYAKYEQIGDTLYFDRDYGHVNILYRGVVLDEDGLPYLNQKEVSAIACYCAYTKKFKEAWATNNANLMQMSAALEQKWFKLCDAARVPESLSQNEMNEILDVRSSWNRKLFNKSFKPVK